MSTCVRKSCCTYPWCRNSWKCNTNVHHDGRTRPHHEYFRSLLMPQGIKTEARYGTFANIYVELGSSGSSRRREGRGFRSGRSPPSSSSSSTCIRPPPQAAGSRRREGRGWWWGRGRARPPPASSALGQAVGAGESPAKSERQHKLQIIFFFWLFTFAANFLIEFPLIGPFGKSA